MKNTNGFHNEKTIAKFNAALHDAMEGVKSGSIHNVHISKGNTKMGDVASVSLLPFNTCPACCASTCGAACYAAKLANLRPNVLKNYAENTAIAVLQPDSYFAQVKTAMAGVRFFRFHVSGDIINAEYFRRMVEAAQENPHCEVLVFTKRYAAVNQYIDSFGALPANLHVLFSGWSNLTPENPHNLPETNVIERGAEPADNWKICGGNCFECGITGSGCWAAKHGEVVAFHKH